MTGDFLECCANSAFWQKLHSFNAVFDEFKNHETGALHNFSQCFPCKIEFLDHDYDLLSRVFCGITVTSANPRSDDLCSEDFGIDGHLAASLA